MKIGESPVCLALHAFQVCKDNDMGPTQVQICVFVKAFDVVKTILHIHVQINLSISSPHVQKLIRI